MTKKYDRLDLFRLISFHNWNYNERTSHFLQHHQQAQTQEILDAMSETTCPFSINDLRRYVCDLDKLSPRKVEKILIWFWKGTDNEQ